LKQKPTFPLARYSPISLCPLYVRRSEPISHPHKMASPWQVPTLLR